MKVKGVVVWGLFCAVLLSGCATNSLFSPYPLQAEVIKQKIMAGEFSAAQMLLGKQSQGADKILYLMERGRISQIAGNIDASVQDFEQVLDLFEANEAAAKMTASGAISKAGAIMLNENAMPYRGETYERVFVHSFQALNFLNQRNLEAAAVEVRRANLEQQQALLEYEDDLNKAEQQDTKARNKAMILANNRNYKQKFSSLTSLSSKVKNSFQNAYTFYISGLIYEINGEYNDAYIDYKKALEIYPDNSYLRGDVVRLARYLGMEEDLERIKGRVSEEKMVSLAKGESRVVVLYEQGYAPEKQEINLFLDLYGVPNNMVFPTYVNHKKNYRPLVVGLSGDRLGETETIVEISAMAAKALEERLPGIIVRQGLRAIAREHWSDRHQDNLFGALAGLGQLLLNRADLRSWLTLPAEVQILHTVVNGGQQTLTLSNGLYNDEMSIQVSPGQTTVIHVIAAGGRLHTRAITL
ncbi:MAG: hypothetical protein L3J70_10445 [Gammaproteobacteria bacterium]|nr:hypothetical protein [Gammaproteobacteria bacterium]